MTRVKHCDPDKSFIVRRKFLPLHLAVVCGAPLSVVGRLIELYPQAVYMTDDKGMLPIHLALRRKKLDDTFRYLLMLFAQSTGGKNEVDLCALISPPPQDDRKNRTSKEDLIHKELRLLVEDLLTIEDQHGLSQQENGEILSTYISTETKRNRRPISFKQISKTPSVIEVSSDISAIDSGSVVTTGPFEDLQTDSPMVAMKPVIAIAVDSTNCESIELIYPSALRWFGIAVDSPPCQLPCLSSELNNNIDQCKTRTPFPENEGSITDKRQAPFGEMASSDWKRIEAYAGFPADNECVGRCSPHGKRLAPHSSCTTLPLLFGDLLPSDSDCSFSVISRSSSESTVLSKGTSLFPSPRKHQRSRTKRPTLAGLAGRRHQTSKSKK